jgi:hypothetical protein
MEAIWGESADACAMAAAAVRDKPAEIGSVKIENGLSRSDALLMSTPPVAVATIV